MPLIHIEQLWNENLFTAEGRIMHDRVDSVNRKLRGIVRIEYSVPLRSLRLGLTGKADVIEFHLTGDKSSSGSKSKEKWQLFAQSGKNLSKLWAAGSVFSI